MIPGPKVAVVGASGSIGSQVVGCARSAGIDVAPVYMPRVAPLHDPARAVGEATACWQRANGGAFDDLCRALAPFDVVINAAGDPRSGSRDVAHLWAANAVLPAVVAQAAQRAGVRRLVHVSTAAVQGRRDPLDESAAMDPLSPYASSKAEGERYLLAARAGRGEVTPELVVYRPASVQAIGHPATHAFARVVSRLPFVPVAGSGDRPVPVALLANVVAGILWAATTVEAAPTIPAIVLQPDEAMTVLRLVEIFGARRMLPLPPKGTNVTLAQLGRLDRRLGLPHLPAALAGAVTARAGNPRRGSRRQRRFLPARRLRGLGGAGGGGARARLAIPRRHLVNAALVAGAKCACRHRGCGGGAAMFQARSSS